MKKKFFVFPIIAVIVVGFCIIGLNRWNKREMTKSEETVSAPLAHTKISYSADSLEKLIKDTDIIIIANTTKEQQEFVYHELTFVKTKVKVKEVLKGNGFDNKEITVLQTKVFEDPVLEKNSNVLLFLHKYEGPVIDDAYVCKGLYQGQFKIKNNIIIPSLADNEALRNDIEKVKNIQSLKEKIKDYK